MASLTLAPRPAATLILVRDSRQGVEVLMMQRTHQAAFAPGGYVFPGGALEADDDHASFSTHCDSMDDATASRLLGLEQGGLSYWVAAQRECFEEAGILLARGKEGVMLRSDGLPHEERLATMRKELAGSEATFAELCQSHGITLALDQLVYFAHWITPAGSPRRFDTRFFIAVAPEAQVPVHDAGETIGHTWVRPSDALSRQRAGEINMMFATINVLESLARFQDVKTLMAHARSVKAVPTFRPRVASKEGARCVLVQHDAAYAEVGLLDPDGQGHVSCKIIPGVATRLSKSVSRIAAPNPGLMTGAGTNSYLVGNDDELAIIDPGPAIPEHMERLLAQVKGRLRWVLVTHTHRDHSPAAMLLREQTGARLAGLPAPAGELQDQSFQPDVVLRDGEHIDVGGCTLRAIHTPGHASNHLCFILEQERFLFTGDHIMQGSTVVINPPDGDMRAYLLSLMKLKQFNVDYIAPGHGFLMEQLHTVIERVVTHRQMREQKVLAALRNRVHATLEDLLPLIYNDVPEKKHAMASRSLLAHLLKLKAEGVVAERAQRWELLNDTATRAPLQ